MNKQDHDALIAAGFTASDFNTTNGWGFEGGVGKSYRHPDGREIREGTAYYRHLPSRKFLTVSHRAAGLTRHDCDPRRLPDFIAGKHLK